jgi:putative membrane protein
MIKSFLRNIAIYTVSLYLLTLIISGVNISGGVQSLLIGGLALTLMFLILKPIFNILTFPFNLITMGLFSVLVNAVILYLLTVFVPNVTISAFNFSGVSLLGFTIAAFHLNTLFAFIIAAVIITIISDAIRWLIK